MNDRKPFTAEVTEIKNLLLQVCERMNDLRGQGIKIEFALTLDQHGNNVLGAFTAYQALKLDH